MLYIVATPIGNLEDMTFRAVRTLKEVDYIFAEDTRVTKKLLSHSDAGTPCISDPGYEVVERALKEGIKVSPIPGCSSLVTAASVSGISMRRMAYEGFLPKKKGRQTLLKKLALEERSIVIFESPHRVVRTLQDIEEYLGVREVAVCREITKMFEEIVRGTTTELIEKFKDRTIKGEVVMIVKERESNKDVNDDD